MPSNVGGVSVSVNIDDGNAQKDVASFIDRLKSGIQSAGNAFRALGRAATQFVSGLLSGAARYGLRAFRNYFFDIANSMPQVQQAIAEIKGNLATAVQPIVERLIPAFQTLLNVLNSVSAVLADIIAKIFGTTAAQSRESAEALNSQAKAYKATGSAAKKAGKQLASFDQLNVLNSNSSSGGGTTGGLTGTAPKFSGGFMSEMEDKINALELLLGEALLVLGAILLFSGVNIPLGIGLIALGAASIAAAASVDWESLKTQMAGPIGRIFALVSAAALVLGAILAFSGANLPLGIALMVIGAAGLATVVALNWDKIKEELTGPMAGIYAVLSVALLVIGGILVFSGISLPLGIALMAAGAAGLVAVTALNWDKIKEELTGPMAGVYAVVSVALLVIGAILVFSGVALPLGIALMAAGAVGLVAITALNWTAIETALQGPIGRIAALASGALLVLGIILTVAGVLPLGIALIVAGAAGLVTVTALNWDSIKEKIVGAWDSIKTWWKTHVAPIFTTEWWAEKFSSISEGLRTKIKDGINTAIDLFNTFIDWINQKLHISWGSFSLFGAEIIPAGEFQLLTLPKIPRLAQGAVIPPNREFMAVLGDQKSGTNIETPLATMVDAFRQALTEGGYGDAVVNLYLDGEKVASNTVKHINRSARAGGRLGIV